MFPVLLFVRSELSFGAPVNNTVYIRYMYRHCLGTDFIKKPRSLKAINRISPVEVNAKTNARGARPAARNRADCAAPDRVWFPDETRFWTRKEMKRKERKKKKKKPRQKTASKPSLGHYNNIIPRETLMRVLCTRRNVRGYIFLQR